MTATPFTASCACNLQTTCSFGSRALGLASAAALGRSTFCTRLHTGTSRHSHAHLRTVRGTIQLLHTIQLVLVPTHYIQSTGTGATKSPLCPAELRIEHRWRASRCRAPKRANSARQAGSTLVGVAPTVGFEQEPTENRGEPGSRSWTSRARRHPELTRFA